MIIEKTTIIFDEELNCRLDELCRLCRVSSEEVIELVEEGVLIPQGSTVSDWYFDYLAVKRLQTAIRLQRELNVNLPGVALVLDLLDELQELRQQCRRL